ncbi:MAG: ABC transporter ATP-binding protein [Chloroflexi bacterium]|nr:ABC transporter ATP-binding protein [Chloroflexota bacterium]
MKLETRNSKLTSPIIQVNHLRKLFPVQKASLWQKEENFVHAVDDVSFELQQGEVLALVGESGCGKSTLALTLMRLEEPTSGQFLFQGQDVTHVKGQPLKAMRRQIQMVFQDPYESLNPTMTIGEIVAEPLVVHGLGRNKNERELRVQQALEDAGLKPASNYVHRYPHELSGGQRQRVVIAGALVLEPTVLLADEPVSMLDVSIRAEILNLLADLRQTRGISILFITHDLGTVAYFADRIAVMYLGRIVELGTTRQVLQEPQHPYTKALISVMPVPNPRLRRERIILQGETPNPINLPSGCRFHPRCPIAQPHCQQVDPEWRAIVAGHEVACHEAGKNIVAAAA